MLLSALVAGCALLVQKDLPRPTPQQLAWQDAEIGMFVHFAPNTWQDQEYDQLSTPLNQINPVRLDTDQWARTAKSMGAKYVMFVAKHAGGFCWWQTNTTDYGVKNTPWRGGKGDVMADVAKSCRKYGLKLGVYLSPQDRKHGIEVGGKAANPAAQAAYAKVFRAQLTELLSKYGPIFEVWFDGSLVFDVGDILRKYAPNAIVFQGPQANIRWVGNEAGVAPSPCWNGAKFDPKTWGTLTAADGDPDGDRWLPNECDTTGRDGWFWNTKSAATLKSVDKLMEIYESSVGHGANLLLNNAPDTSGLIPSADVRRMREFGDEITRRYGAPIVFSHGTGDTVTVQPSAPVVVDAVETMEDIALGERIREYVIEGLVDGQWTALAKGTSIGHKKIDKFSPTRVIQIRVRITRSVGEPQIRRIAIYNTGS